jgi:hypothetical protein
MAPLMLLLFFMIGFVNAVIKDHCTRSIPPLIFAFGHALAVFLTPAALCIIGHVLWPPNIPPWFLSPYLFLAIFLCSLTVLLSVGRWLWVPKQASTQSAAGRSRSAERGSRRDPTQSTSCASQLRGFPLHPWAFYAVFVAYVICVIAYALACPNPLASSHSHSAHASIIVRSSWQCTLRVEHSQHSDHVHHIPCVRVMHVLPQQPITPVIAARSALHSLHRSVITVRSVADLVMQRTLSSCVTASHQMLHHVQLAEASFDTTLHVSVRALASVLPLLPSRLIVAVIATLIIMSVTVAFIFTIGVILIEFPDHCLALLSSLSMIAVLMTLLTVSDAAHTIVPGAAWLLDVAMLWIAVDMLWRSAQVIRHARHHDNSAHHSALDPAAAFNLSGVVSTAGRWVKSTRRSVHSVLSGARSPVVHTLCASLCGGCMGGLRAVASQAVGQMPVHAANGQRLPHGYGGGARGRQLCQCGQCCVCCVCCASLPLFG